MSMPSTPLQSPLFPSRLPDPSSAMYEKEADRRLWQAIVQEDLLEVERALTDGADSNMEEPDRLRRMFAEQRSPSSASATPLSSKTALTPLGLAIAQGWTPVFDLLARHGANPWKGAINGPSPWQLVLERLAHPKDAASGAFQPEAWAQAGAFAQAFRESLTAADEKSTTDQQHLLCRLIEGKRVWAGRWLREQGVLDAWAEGLCLFEHVHEEELSVSWKELQKSGDWEWLWMLDEALPSANLRATVEIDWVALDSSAQPAHPPVRSEQASAEHAAECIAQNRFEDARAVWGQRWRATPQDLNPNSTAGSLLPDSRTPCLMALHRVFGLFRFEGAAPVEDSVALNVLCEIERLIHLPHEERLTAPAKLDKRVDLPGFALRYALQEEADPRTMKWIAQAFSATTLLLNWGRSQPGRLLLHPMLRSLLTLSDSDPQNVPELKERIRLHDRQQNLKNEQALLFVRQKTKELVSLSPTKAIELAVGLVQKGRKDALENLLDAGVSPLDRRNDGKSLFEIAWSVGSTEILSGWIEDPITSRELLSRIDQDGSAQLDAAMREGLQHLRQAGFMRAQPAVECQALEAIWANWQQKMLAFALPVRTPMSTHEPSATERRRLGHRL